MNKTRVIPVLLLRGKGLVKTIKFKDPVYIGDPINTVRIFNEKEVDELIFLDITATPERRGPDFELLADIAGEAFMPMAYGGGITKIEEIKRLFSLGFEKVVIDSSAYDQPELIKEAVDIYGSQSIVGCVDVKQNVFGKYQLASNSGLTKRAESLEKHLQKLQEIGVGEILVNAVHRDGTQKGYDLDLIRAVSSKVSIPVVACGGAANINDLALAAKDAGASAVAAGSLFVFVGPHRAVLINYPERSELISLLP